MQRPVGASGDGDDLVEVGSPGRPESLGKSASVIAPAGLPRCSVGRLGSSFRPLLTGGASAFALRKRAAAQGGAVGIVGSAGTPLPVDWPFAAEGFLSEGRSGSSAGVPTEVCAAAGAAAVSPEPGAAERVGEVRTRVVASSIALIFGGVAEAPAASTSSRQQAGRICRSRTSRRHRSRIGCIDGKCRAKARSSVPSDAGVCSSYTFAGQQRHGDGPGER